MPNAVEVHKLFHFFFLLGFQLFFKGLRFISHRHLISNSDSFQIHFRSRFVSKRDFVLSELIKELRLISTAGKTARFVRRSWRGSNPHHPSPRSRVWPPSPTRLGGKIYLFYIFTFSTAILLIISNCIKLFFVILLIILLPIIFMYSIIFIYTHFKRPTRICGSLVCHVNLSVFIIFIIHLILFDTIYYYISYAMA
jgi:hypothetical protein